MACRWSACRRAGTRTTSRPGSAGTAPHPSASAAKIQAALQRVLSQPWFREAAGRLRRAIQADMAADRAIAELEALTGAPTMLERFTPSPGG
jgi:hypothetical protein